MSEQDMRKRVIKELKSLDAFSVENKVNPGTPDLNYIEGWIELKWMKRWTRNCETSPVLIHHFTQQQRIRLKRRHQLGGKAFLLLQVGREWLLWKGDVAAEFVGKITRSEMIEKAIFYSDKGWDKEIMKCLN